MLSFSSNLAEEGKQYTQRPGAYALIKNQNGQVAIILTGKRYFLPGGGVEGEETLETCLKRECLEEIAADITILEKFAEINCYFYSTTRNIDMESIGHFFICDINCITDIKSEADHELIWLSFDDAIKSLFLSNQQEAVKRLSEVN